MKTIHPDQLIKAEELRVAERELRRKQIKNTKKKRREAAKQRTNTYTLFISGHPTDEQRDMFHLEAMMMNQVIREKFCAHIRDCLDSGIQNEEKLSEWRCTEHWSRKPAEQEAQIIPASP